MGRESGHQTDRKPVLRTSSETRLERDNRKLQGEATQHQEDQDKGFSNTRIFVRLKSTHVTLSLEEGGLGAVVPSASLRQVRLSWDSRTSMPQQAQSSRGPTPPSHSSVCIRVCRWFTQHVFKAHRTILTQHDKEDQNL